MGKKEEDISRSDREGAFGSSLDLGQVIAGPRSFRVSELPFAASRQFWGPSFRTDEASHLITSIKLHARSRDVFRRRAAPTWALPDSGSCSI